MHSVPASLSLLDSLYDDDSCEVCERNRRHVSTQNNTRQQQQFDVVAVMDEGDLATGRAASRKIESVIIESEEVAVSLLTCIHPASCTYARILAHRKL